MAKPKKKLLPKNFEALLKEGDLEKLQEVFESCDVNARGGYTKQTALAYNDCPDALVRWLVEQGADLMAEDNYGETPLHARARHWQGHIEILLELGADVHRGENLRGTPLHTAAGAHNLRTAQILLQHGARANALNREKMTPLAYALQRCGNANLENMAPLAELLLEKDRPAPAKSGGLFAKIFGSQSKGAGGPDLKALVSRIGTEFEFHRSNFNPDSVDAASAALDRLYQLFDVPPVPRRTMHDGKTPIVAKAANWEDCHQELWELLVPSSGHAATVQGEVIRLSGRIRNELEGNGGINWDADFRKMADAFLKHVGSGKSLPDTELADARYITSELKGRRGDTVRLCELAVSWVARNPQPLKLAKPNYSR
jgi:Ankyrin repeats (many copies)